MHRLPVVGADIIYSGPSATAEAEPEAEPAEEAADSSDDSSSSEEPEVGVEDLRRATTSKIWRLRFRDIDR